NLYAPAKIHRGAPTSYRSRSEKSRRDICRRVSGGKNSHSLSSRRRHRQRSGGTLRPVTRSREGPIMLLTFSDELEMIGLTFCMSFYHFRHRRIHAPREVTANDQRGVSRRG